MKAKYHSSLLILLFLGSAAAGQTGIASPERVEPPFWWVGMQDPHLQLMISGKDLGRLTPNIDCEGVRLERSIRVENPNYVFLDLLILDNQHPTEFDVQLLEGGQVRATYRYRLLERAKGSAQRAGFSPADAIYLITPDRFVNGDPANDNVAGMREIADRNNPDGRHGGDIRGIINSLDYIRDLGFTALWINPLTENDQPSYSYHGYSITDFYRTDPRYGTNEDYLLLSDLAHEKGLKLIMDMVLNHCGSEHWWMKDLPTVTWFNFENKFVGTNHRRTTVQDPYAAATDSRGFADGWFVPTMPDLNQTEPLMANYLIQNTIWWIEYAGLDGIRMDTYSYPDKEFMSRWTCRVLQEYPNFNIVGEEWSENPALVAHWQRGKVNANGYTSCLPSLMDFPLQGALQRALTEKEGWSDGWIRLYEMVANDFIYPDPYNLVVFPDNHDMSRFFAQIGEDFDLFRLGITYLLTTRGIPQIFYGTEVLMTSPAHRVDGLIRSDFPGGWPGDKADALTGKGLSKDQKAAKEFLRTLLNWRKSQPAVHSGRMTHFAPQDGVYVFFRYDESDKVMVVLNKNEQEQSLDLSRFAEMLQGVKSGTDVLSKKKFDLRSTLLAPGHSPLVLEIEE